MRLEFAINLINAGKFDEAMRVLRTISAADRKAQSALTDRILKLLLDKNSFTPRSHCNANSSRIPLNYP